MAAERWLVTTPDALDEGQAQLWESAEPLLARVAELEAALERIEENADRSVTVYQIARAALNPSGDE